MGPITARPVSSFWKDVTEVDFTTGKKLLWLEASDCLDHDTKNR